MPDSGEQLKKDKLNDIGEITDELKKLGNVGYKERMAKFGINSENAFGVAVPYLRKLAKRISPSATVAMGLWKSEIHEAKILSTMVYPAIELTEADAENMSNGLHSWDICDHFTGNLVANSKPSLIINLIQKWAYEKDEYMKRAAFSLIASLEGSKWYTGENSVNFLRLIKAASADERNFVKKAVLWALREIGKSSEVNRIMALSLSEELIQSGCPSSRWVGKAALRELEGKRKKIKSASGNQ